MEGIDLTQLSRRRAAALAAGHSPAELRSELWVRRRHGVVTPAFFAGDPLAARLSDAVALLGPDSALGGWASFVVQGNEWFDGTDRSGGERDVLIHCLPGSQLRVRPGLRPSEGLVHPDELIDLGAYRVATMARAAYDEMRLARSLREAVVVHDMAVTTTSEMPHTSPTAIAAVIASHHKTRGIRQATRASALGSSRSASPAETRTRLVAQLDADLHGLTVNIPLFGLDESLLGVADLLQEETGLVIETDGEHHAARDQRTTDHRRDQRFEEAGAVVVRVTTEEHGDNGALVGRLRNGHRRAARVTRRDWTTVKPAWWFEWPPGRRWD